MQMLKNGMPRRISAFHLSEAEIVIRNAVKAVEKAGSDPLLTDAVLLLNQAMGKVADFIEKPKEVICWMVWDTLKNESTNYIYTNYEAAVGYCQSLNAHDSDITPYRVVRGSFIPETVS